ncbi:hypothetical protein CkaCkLH20_01313 [Colletotrichum karsti]|uniref:Spo12-like protein n=1 Tax=Colletotrichum karsti TaxID=1095194 RepID=A0A9P6IE41_9PEZI|nr:uncharacterized protein CkaCkLH20_01313 [Colletotrichum karsti]KAF9881163.1 hypothetical protein CkaCkLH20_01313 [Colletotrichum karsti]
MASNVLAEKDVNTPVAAATNEPGSKEVKSMEYHRQVLQDKMAQENSKTYISPSDNIMSPCTAKLNALRNKQVGKVKPKSLFAQHSAKKLEGDALFGSRTPSPPKENAF